MQLGLSREQGEALALYNIDSEAPPQVLKKLAALPNIISVKQVKL
jgi:dihydrodipicolinate synthase/N-acetylneuraminate lyase